MDLEVLTILQNLLATTNFDANPGTVVVDVPGIRWTEYREGACAIHIRGGAFNNDEFLENRKLALRFEAAIKNIDIKEHEAKLRNVLMSLNGNFAVIINSEEWFFAAVDRIRSIPLFYGDKKGSFFLSNNANWVREKTGDKAPDPLSIKEFMLTGYVTGRDTLYPRVKQLQAGEYLWFSNKDDNIGLKTERYYEWIHSDYFDITEEELCGEMDCMHMKVFERLISSTRERTIVVPLSGGYDSRLIVTMLKRLGRDNVVCFSYGRLGNRESAISQKVAEKLGYPWHFIPYSFGTWHKWYRTTERVQYCDFGSGLCSLPHLQDWPAVWALKERGVIPENAVFVPGHTGDMISGGHLPRSWGYKSEADADVLLNAIWKRHYSLWKTQIKAYKDLEDKIKSQLYDKKFDSVENMASAFEYQNWQERQAKFIVNSIRVYEFWGYDWRLPFWDNEFMEFWRRVPLGYRLKKKLYNNYVKKLFGEFGVDVPEGKNVLSKAPYIRTIMNMYHHTYFGMFSLKDLFSCVRFYQRKYGGAYRSLSSFSNVLPLLVLGEIKATK